MPLSKIVVRALLAVAFSTGGILSSSCLAAQATTAPPAKESIAGTITNKFGIRDDVARYLESKKYAPSQAKAAQQEARAFQALVLSGATGKPTPGTVTTLLALANRCLADNFPENGAESFTSVRDNIAGLTANTKERIYAYSSYMKSISGGRSAPPDNDYCD
jgi:hypothetical protein